MRTHLFRFVLKLIVVCFCFTAPELASGSTPPQRDTVSPNNWQHDNRRYARSLATADVGDPRTVRLIYFLPNDQDFRAEVVQRMKDEIRSIQAFYREQMQAHGHGARTFRVETDAQGEPVVHRVDGQHHNSYYQESNVWDTTLAEVEPRFDVNANIYLVVFDNHRERIGRLFGVSGYGIRLNKTAGFVLLPGEFTFKNTVHELGHAFGVQHDFHDDAYMMSYGEAPDKLSACSANFLAVHSYFNPDVPLDQDSWPALELISPLQYPKNAESVSVQFKVNDPDGLHQALLFSTTKRPHNAEGSPEVFSCLNFAGERSAVAAFDYNGFLASIGFGNLAEWSIHPISVIVVDKHGNIAGDPIRLTEFKPGQIATIETLSFVVASPPYSVALSRDGALIAASGLHALESKAYLPQVRLWVRETGENIAKIDGGASVAISPDGKTLAYGSWQGFITLWDVETQKVIFELHGHAVWSNALAFSPDGRTLASGGHDAAIKLWDVASGAMIGTFDGHQDIVNSVAFSPDGSALASGSKDTTTKLWDVVTRSEAATVEHSNPVTSVAFSPNGAIIASGVVHGGAVLWDVQRDVQIKTSIARYEFGLRTVSSVAYSPDGILVADDGNNTVTLLDTTTGGVLNTLVYHAPLQFVTFSPDGRSLATCTSIDDNTSIELWNLSALSAPSNEVVPDARLRTALRFRLDKPAGSLMGVEELAMVTDLFALRASIHSLAGLEFASNLRALFLDENNISELAPLSGLTNLTALGISKNNISDLTPLASLTNLTELELFENSISEFSALEGLTNLTLLALSNNNISDISPLSALVNLDALFLAGNKLADISALSGLTNLKTLHLAVNSISDISPLIANSGLGEGDTLFLRKNPLNYEAVNSHIPLLQNRGVTVSFIDRTPTTLQPIAGGDQQGVPSAPLADPFVVEVLDEHGDVFEGVPVTFTVPEEGGRLSATTTTTDADGRARSILTLGQRTGTIIVTVSAAEITEIAELVTFTVVSQATPPRLWADVNGDGIVNVQDLALVAFSISVEKPDAAMDVNRDGVVNIQDVVLVAAAFGNAGAAPSVLPPTVEQLDASDVRRWLNEARSLENQDATVQEGILALEQLLEALTPTETRLLPNFPNPFNPETWIPYHLLQGAEVEITIYDTKGALVRELVRGHQETGYYADRDRAAYWDGRNESGEPVASGVYFYRLRAGDYTASRRMVIVK